MTVHRKVPIAQRFMRAGSGEVSSMVKYGTSPAYSAERQNGPLLERHQPRRRRTRAGTVLSAAESRAQPSFTTSIVPCSSHRVSPADGVLGARVGTTLRQQGTRQP